MSASDTRSLLLNSATPELYRTNVFRLTGLGVTAGAREVARQMDKLKMLAELGGQAAQMGHGGGGGASATAEELREAGQRLKQVEARSLNEFFWFWPQEWGNAGGDPTLVAVRSHDLEGAMKVWREWEKGIAGDEALAALLEYDFESALKIWEGWKNEMHWQMGLVAAHNLAVGTHMLALEKTRADLEEGSPFDRTGAEALQDMWKEVWVRWQAVIQADAVWDIFHDRIRQVNDPALITSFARRLRQDLQTALSKVNAEVAMRYLQCEKLMEADYHACYVKVESRSNETVVELRKEMLTPWRSRIEQAVLAAEEAARKEVKKGMLHATALLETTEPLLKVIEMFYDPDDEVSQQVCNRVAAAVTDMTVKAYDSVAFSILFSCYTGEPNQEGKEGCILNLQRAEILTTDADVSRRAKEYICRMRSAMAADLIFAKLMTPMQESQSKTPAHLLKRVETKVLPKLDALLKDGVLDLEIQCLLCLRMSHYFNNYSASLRETWVKHMASFKRGVSLAVLYSKSPSKVETLRKQEAVKKKWFSWKLLYQDDIISSTLYISVIVLIVCFLKYCGKNTHERSGFAQISQEQIEQQNQVGREMIMRAAGMAKEKGKIPETGIHWVGKKGLTDGGYLVLHGTPGEGNFYVKLVDRTTGLPVFGLFVRDGEATYAILVPTGSYEVRFAHGGAWQGVQELFGPETKYRRMLSDLSFDRGNRHTLQLSKEAGTPLIMDWRAGRGF